MSNENGEGSNDKNSEILRLRTADRPHSVALITAIEDVIYEIAPGKITHIEVLGVLDLVGKNIYASMTSVE